MTIADRLAAGGSPFTGANSASGTRDAAGASDLGDTRKAAPAARSELVTVVLAAIAAPGEDMAEDSARVAGNGEGWAELLGALLETHVQDGLLALEIRAWDLALARMPTGTHGGPEVATWDRLPARRASGAALTSARSAPWSDRLDGAALGAERRMTDLPVFSMPDDPSHGHGAFRIPAGAICRAAAAPQFDLRLGEAVLASEVAEEEA